MIDFLDTESYHSAALRITVPLKGNIADINRALYAALEDANYHSLSTLIDDSGVFESEERSEHEAEQIEELGLKVADQSRWSGRPIILTFVEVFRNLCRFDLATKLVELAESDDAL